MLSRLEYLVLTLLADESPAYGLDLVARSRHTLKRGTVYVTLGRMEQKGLVTSELERRPGLGPPRRLYEPTALGLRLCTALKPLKAALRLGVVK